MRVLIIACSCLLVLSSIVYAKGKPSVPYVHQGTCEGGDCAKQKFVDYCQKKKCKSEGCDPAVCESGFSYVVKGKLQSDKPLKVRSKPFDPIIAFTIPGDKEFEILSYDLYTIKSRPLKLDKEEGESCGPRPLVGKTVYVLYYLGEGLVQVWNGGEEFACSLKRLPKGAYKTQLWYNVEYNGKKGWWGLPSNCSLLNRRKGCPVFR